MKGRASYFATFLALIFPFCARANDESPRPKILGIALVRLSVADPNAYRQFYSTILDEPEYGCHWCETEHPGPIRLPSGQILTIDVPKPDQPSQHVASVVFAIDDADAMRKYLKDKNIKIDEGPKPDFRTKDPVQRPSKVPANYQSRFIYVTDPEGHHIGFWQVPQTLWPNPHTAELRIIHYGIVVKDVVAEDHFYKDILGFQLYWHGGRSEGKDDWVAMQVPDGTDWVEYMLNIPIDADQRTLGVASHIALGVADINDVQERLIKNNVRLTEEPTLGLDGKWQLNVYDPDKTRIEFMEFKPKAKPCCSEFRGPQPGPE